MEINLKDKQLPAFFARALEQDLELDTYMQSLMDQLHEKIEQAEGFEVTLQDKLELSKYIIQEGIKEHGIEHTAVAWTGGKDSTLILWLTRQVCEENGWEMPHCIFINEGHVFEEVEEFVEELSNKWNLEVTEVHNADVSTKAKKIGDMVKVKDLDKRNQKEVERVGYDKDEFPFEPESMVGNHLMKTVAMNRYLETVDYTAIITGIRWDEQEARAQESFFSPRGDEHTPEHTRIHPILHLTERDIWNATLENQVPYCKLYEEGFRSLGAKGTTEKADDKPAWEQDFEAVSERAGRRQDKEQIMKRLRDLGYM